MRLIIEAVMILVILSMGTVVLFQQSQIASLEYRSEAFFGLSDDFAKDVIELKTRLIVACAYREPIEGTDINWTKVCRAGM